MKPIVRVRFYNYRVLPQGVPKQWFHFRATTPKKAKEACIASLTTQGARLGNDPTFWDVQVIEPDHCVYCGANYHPMAVHTNAQGGKIWACRFTILFDADGEYLGFDEDPDCKHKAVADGYNYRPDLTPTR